LDLTESAEERDFRAEAREWLRANVPREERPTHGQAMRDFDVGWQRTQYDGGWAGISWPAEYGGRGLSIIQQMIWVQEYAAADAPYAGCCYVGLNHGGPTLIVRGTEEQQAQHLPAILKGESIWCQGFSEPNAGSDLASLRTRAEIDGDTLVVNGQKIWTSYAQFADYQELLVRTDPSERHRGITWVICDMHSPGVEVRPIEAMARVSHFAEVFYDDVRIPLSNVVGEVNDGWSVAQTTFSFERGTGFMAEQMELVRIVDNLIELARGAPYDGDHDLGEALPLDERLAIARAEVTALGAMTFALISKLERAPERGGEGVLVRIFHSELVQRVHKLALEVLGSRRLEFHPWGSAGGWTGSFLRSFHVTIGGGTTDIARNVVAERVLGLPRIRSGA
jgi:alkylation response protein AidB-like acyl-CoA dehydrogenase